MGLFDTLTSASKTAALQAKKSGDTSISSIFRSFGSELAGYAKTVAVKKLKLGQTYAPPGDENLGARAQAMFGDVDTSDPFAPKGVPPLVWVAVAGVAVVLILRR